MSTRRFAGTRGDLDQMHVYQTTVAEFQACADQLANRFGNDAS